MDNLPAAPETIVRLVTRKLMPLLMLCYLIAYLDRSNISVAALQMNADLGLTAQMYGIGAGLFYVTYVAFEVPSNVILARMGARLWIARIMITWGLIACGMAFIQTPVQLYTMRLMLGAAEAGFTPGVIYYLSGWFPGSTRARAMSWFFTAAVLASVVGLPISGALLDLHGLMGWAGWRWLFFLEGIPAVLLGVVVLRMLPDRPAVAPWLSREQSTWIENQIAAESSQNPSGKGGHHLSEAFSDPRVWLLSLFWLLQAFGTTGVTLFLPQILKMVSGKSDFVVTLLAALPFLLACVLMHLNGRNSDASGERQLHLGIPLLLAGGLLTASVFVDSVPLSYGLLVAALAFNWASTPVFWAVATRYVSAGVAGAGAIALINALANLSGVGLPPLIGFLRDRTGSYDSSLLLVAAALLAGGVLGLWLASPSVGRRQKSKDK